MAEEVFTREELVEQLLDLERTRYSGVSDQALDGRRETMRSVSDLDRLIADLKGRIGALDGGNPPIRRVTVFQDDENGNTNNSV